MGWVLRGERAAAWPLLVGLVVASAGWLGCASGKPERREGADAAAEVGADLLVWDGTTLETVWVRDGEVIARRPEIVVAAGGVLHALRFVNRMAYDSGGSCSDGCEHCGEPEPDPRPEPPPPKAVAVEELFAVPLAGGAMRLLATPTTQEDVTCGVAGSRPWMAGGIESRVSIAWTEGETTSAVPGTQEMPRGAVWDLATGELVTLSTPPGFADKARAVLLACDVAADYRCETLPEEATITGPIALQMVPHDWGDGAPSTGLYGMAAREVWGADYDAMTWIEVDDTLGLGPIPAEAIAIAARTWTATQHFGFSHLSGTRAALDAALALFRVRP